MVPTVIKSVYMYICIFVFALLFGDLQCLHHNVVLQECTNLNCVDFKYTPTKEDEKVHGINLLLFCSNYQSLMIPSVP